MQITRSSSDTAKGPVDWFTGDVYIDSVAAAPPPSRVTANLVHFRPGAINEGDDEHHVAVDDRVDAAFLEPARTSSTDLWEAAFRDGAAMSLDEAIAYALDEARPR